jgi:cell division protein FtsW
MLGKIIENIKGDKYIWYTIVALSAISLLLVYSSTRSLAYRNEHGNTEYYLLRHGLFLLIGMFIVYMVHRIDHRYFSRMAQMMLFLSIPLLLYTTFFGVTINDASRWVKIPLIGLTFQSSDFAKLALIMYTSRTLSKKQGVIKDFKEVTLHIMLPIVGICHGDRPGRYADGGHGGGFFLVCAARSWPGGCLDAARRKLGAAGL